jgi:2-hydroxy-6-oxonona-2,4-dienedioate hydrolase
MIGIKSPRLFAEIEGIRTAYYRKTGSASENPAIAVPTVVLFHGGAPGACSDLNWFNNFEALVAAGFDVVAYDQPGFGYSAVPDDHSIEFRYRHARSFLDYLEAESVHLVGNSIGGLLSTLLAYRLMAEDAAPKIVSLVLAAPFPYFPVPDSVSAKLQNHRQRLGSIESNFDSIRALCLNTFNQASLVTDDIVNLRLSMLQGDRWSAYKRRGETGRAFNSAEIQNAILNVPTLMIWGLDDRSLPVEIGIEAINHLSNAQFLFLPHCGHWPQTEQAGQFNYAAIGFLQTLKT